jgi:hypothetical protein
MDGQVFRRCTTCGRRVDRTEHPTRCSGRQSKWAFRADLGVDHEGRRVQKRGGSYRTRQDAERALREVLVRVDRATYVEPSTRTVEQYLLTEWLPTQAPPRVSPQPLPQRTQRRPAPSGALPRPPAATGTEREPPRPLLRRPAPRSGPRRRCAAATSSRARHGGSDPRRDPQGPARRR